MSSNEKESKRVKKQPPCGILNIHKPKGLTSRQVVNRIQRLAKPAKVGHAGTLDPMATGVLAVCVGRATRLVPYIQNYHKKYNAQFVLGKRSNTDDITGDVTEAPNFPEINQSDIEKLLPQFRGIIQQTPPQFSAVHIDGKRAYQLARQGEQVEIPSRDVEVYELEMTQFDFPDFTLEMKCGSGTYVRSIGRDMGELLKCGAVMTNLVRTEIGLYNIANTVLLDEITEENWGDFLLPPSTAVCNLPSYHLTNTDCQQVIHGRPVLLKEEITFPSQATVALFKEENQLAALAEYKPQDNLLAPRVVFL